MNNRNISITINQNSETPNAVQSQVAQPLATDNSKSGIFNRINELPVKRALGVIGAKKIADSVIQRIGTYTGNQVLQRNIDNTISITEATIGFGVAVATLGKVGAVAYVANEVINYGVNMFDHSLQMGRANIESKYASELANTTLNHNRYKGGQR